MFDLSIKNSEILSNESKNILLAILQEMEVIEKEFPEDYPKSECMAVESAFAILRTSFLRFCWKIENDELPRST